MMPDGTWLQGALRKAVAAVLGLMLALVLLVALLLTGFYLLVNAATVALTPLLGPAGAMAATGFFCFLLLALFFYRMTRPVRSGGDQKPGRSLADTMADVIRKNPLEAASIAFVLGIAEQGDPKLKMLLLQGGMTLMRQSDSPSGQDGVQPPPET
ncbi:MAG TPA: hypothetical protein VKY53_11430 [Marinobacter sp.]|nr:hypothetical protein [Marinobacter sp.]